MAANKMAGEIGLEGADSAPGNSNGAITWERDNGTVGAGIYTVNGPPVGNLGGKLGAATRALVIQMDAVLPAPMLWVTTDGGTNWTPLLAP